MTAATIVPLRTVLEGLSIQLHRMSAIGAEVEDAVGHSIGRSAPAASEGETLQKLDNLVQSLAGIAAYVDRLARDIDPACGVDPRDAVAAVNQKSLAAALAGLEPCHVDSGSADFF